MRVNCAGGGDFFGRFFKCDKHHGVLAIQQAIPLSCDTFFYALAEKLGIDTIAKYATGLGIGSKTGVDLPNEMAGVMPSTKWKMKNFHEKWYAGEVISVGIGQGAVAVTPIQLVRALSGIASNGNLVRPHLVNQDQVPAQLRQAMVDNFTGSGVQQVSLDSDTWMTVTEGMAAATTTGTAAASHLEGIDFAGKTGTAQVVGGGDTHVKGGARTPNAWFVGMVPRRNPEFAVVVLQEHGDWGAGSALIASKIVNAYVTKKRRQDGNLLLQADKKAAPVEVGAVWSVPSSNHQKGEPEDSMSGGHFEIAAGASDAAENADLFRRMPSKPGQPATERSPEQVAMLPARFRGVIR
jgi:penicillin-binding protein 2